MSDLTSDDVAAKLLAGGFQRTGPAAVTLTDPIADTPMVVTLDQLRPYDLNPRVTRNPLYDDIKASIRERGLDAPPAITRRPGEPHYIIRNGGNTRLAILAELWTETRDERFFRIPCLFRPWSARGEIVALTGHLAENELHGSLSFIERALGVEKARELYEQEGGGALSQSELARRLSRDGYPITQPHISRMQDAVRFLLPAIPTLLYGGLGKHQVERLAAMRRAAARVWEQHAKTHSDDFSGLFQDVLTLFDGQPETFSAQRVQDELVGQMAERLDADYDTLSLDIDEAETKQRALSRDPVAPPMAEPAAEGGSAAPRPFRHNDPPPAPINATKPRPGETPSHDAHEPSHPVSDLGTPPAPSEGEPRHRQDHIVSPAPDTERLQAIRQLVADHTGETVPDFASTVVQAIPVQAGGLYPIADVWYIAPALDDPAPLRTHIAQLAREIAAEADVDTGIVPLETGIGYGMGKARADHTSPSSFAARAVRSLLDLLSVGFLDAPSSSADAARDRLRLADDLAPLLLGGAMAQPQTRLSDAALVKLYRLVRLARRLHDHAVETPAAHDDRE
ncbi:ParB family protein [Burkholderia pseudomallei]|uniref:ParB family protein n=1 Tax=Burkholderia pseudomallei TaxID=28450 RepID=UPI0005EA0EAE|nr:ParB family protein [Burkholderia pseudomallei]CFL01985.1 ParB domain-containing protein nuclease [Burkholderia pseudomallei]